MRCISGFALVALLLFLTGCANLGGTFTVDRFLNKEITGDTIGACMARSYQAWARNKAWVQVDYAGAVELAERAEAANPPSPLSGRSFLTLTCGAGHEAQLALQVERFQEVALKDPARECACGNALVEIERWSCAKPGDDKEALKRRFDAQAAACEGRIEAK